MVHGDDDQIVPIAAGLKTAQLLKDATLKVYEGGPHGIVGSPFASRLNNDLLGFVNA